MSIKKYLIPFLVLFSISLLLIMTHYKARENDSRLYTSEVVELMERPMVEWIAPKWNPETNCYQYDKTVPYIQDHPMGNLIPGLLLSAIGIPAYASLYIVNVFYKIAIILLMYNIARRYYSDEKASFILIAGQIIVGSIGYQLRSNHEQLLLLGVVFMFYSLLAVEKKYLQAFGIAASFTILILTKGVFAVLGGFVLFADLLVTKRTWKDRFFLYGTGLLALLPIAAIYEFWYYKVTGISFIAPYWKIQIAARTLQETEMSLGIKLLQKFKNLYHYSSRALVSSLPWSLFALGLPLFSKKTRTQFKFDPLSKMLLIYVLGQICFFSLSNRLAARYVYQSFIILGFLFVFQAYDFLPRLQNLHKRYFHPHKINCAFLTLLGLTLISLITHFIQYPDQVWP